MSQVVSPKPVQPSQFETQRASVEAKLNTGQALNIFDAIFLSRNYPEASRQYALVQRTNVELATGRSPDIFEGILISKYAPETARQMAQPQQEPRTVSVVNRAGQKQSQIFYSNIGHPEFGGEYAPFDIPKGMQVSKLEETSGGLQVSFEAIGEASPTQQKSLAEMLSGIVVTPFTSLLGLKSTSIDREMMLGLKEPTARPLAVVGGVIAPFEAIGYTVGSFAGLKTPALPPWPTAENPEYSVGFILGEAGLLFTSTYALGKVAEGIGKVGVFVEEKTKIGQTVTESPVGQKAIEISEQLPSRPKFTGSGTEEWLIEHSDVYRAYAEKSITPGIVDVPDIGYVASRTMSEKVLGLPELESPYQVQGLQAIEAEAGAMSFANVPKTMILDPQVSGALENPITRQIFTLPTGLPVLPIEDIERASFLLPTLGIASIVGLQIASSQMATPMIKTDLASRVLPSIEAMSRLTKMSLPTISLSYDLASALASEETPISKTLQESMATPIQRTIQEPLTQTIQLPKTANVFPPEFVQLTPTHFPNQLSFDLYSKRLFKPKKPLRTGWERKYMWEFPVKGAKEMLKALK